MKVSANLARSVCLGHGAVDPLGTMMLVLDRIYTCIQWQCRAAFVTGTLWSMSRYFTPHKNKVFKQPVDCTASHSTDVVLGRECYWVSELAGSPLLVRGRMMVAQ